MPGSRTSGFITDAQDWKQRWAQKPVAPRENAMYQIGQGRAVADTDYAPFAWRIAIRQRPLVFLMLAFPAVAAIGMTVAGVDPAGVAFTTVLLGAYLGGMAVYFEWRIRAAIARNAAVIGGMDPDEANKTLPSGRGARVVRAVGLFVVSYLIVSLTGGLFVAFGVAMLSAAGIDVDPQEPISPALQAGWWPVALVLTWLVYRALVNTGPEPQ